MAIVIDDMIPVKGSSCWYFAEKDPRGIKI